MFQNIPDKIQKLQIINYSINMQQLSLGNFFKIIILRIDNR